MNFRKKLGIAATGLLLSCSLLSGQDAFLKDTLFMNAVEITAPRSYRFTPFTVTSIETGSISRFQADDIGVLLRASSTLSVKRNGNSGLASVSMRGLSASHTRVTWNGISVSSPSAGMTDFALIPVCAASSVLISGGGADLNEITGALGGKIEFMSDNSVINGIKTSLILNAGSFDDYSAIVSFSAGNGKLTTSTAAWEKTSYNNFYYKSGEDETGIVKERRDNAAYSTYGVIQDFLIKSQRSSFSAHLWYNDTKRDLPGPVMEEEQDYGESQKDRSVRGVLNFLTTGNKTELELTAGYTNDDNLYFNAIPAFNGDNNSSVTTLKAHINYNPSGSLQLSFNLGDEYQIARSLAYNEKKKRNLLSASFTGVYTPARRVKLTIQAREVVSGSAFIQPEFTAGGAFFITPDGKNILKTNISRNVNLPCMNDLYWVPGGNAELKPEVSTGGEMGYSFNTGSASEFQGSFDLTLFASDVRDLIQWMPDETFTIWSPANIMKVRVRGAETRLTSSFPFNHGRVNAGAAYAFTSSVVSSTGFEDDPSIGKQLVYTPLHHLSANISASYRFLRGGFMVTTDGKRYTIQDNSEWLEKACIMDANIGSAFVFHRLTLLADLTVRNLLNTAWESVKYYPMPLRTYSLSLKVVFDSAALKN